MKTGNLTFIGLLVFLLFLFAIDRFVMERTLGTRLCEILQFFRQLEAIKKERLAQILVIGHSDEEDTEEADSYGLRDSSTDEEDEEEEHHENQQSPDSLLQSPSPGKESAYIFQNVVLNIVY